MCFLQGLQHAGPTLLILSDQQDAALVTGQYEAVKDVHMVQSSSVYNRTESESFVLGQTVNDTVILVPCERELFLFLFLSLNRKENTFPQSMAPYDVLSPC